MANRVTQTSVEVAVVPNTQKVRATQASLEVAVVPNTQKVRATQVYVEVAVKDPTYSAHADLVFDAIVRATRHADLTPSPVIDQLAHGDLGIDYHLGFPTVTASLALDYTILDLATKDLALAYEINAQDVTQVGADLGFEYTIDVAGGVHKDLTFTARITKATKIQQRGADLGFKYRITRFPTAGRNLQFGYIVSPPITHVGVNLPFAYAMEPFEPARGVDLQFAYTVDPPITQVGADLIVDWEIDAYTTEGADLAFTAEVELPRPRSELTFDANIFSVAGADLVIDYSDRTTVSGDLALDYVVRSTSAGDLEFEYQITSSLVRLDLDLDYEIEAATTVTIPRRHSQGYVLVPPGSDLPKTKPSQRGRYPRQVGVDYTFDAPILGIVRATFSFDAQLRQLVTTKVGFDHKIAVLAGSDTTFDSERYDFYDWNRSVLLAEIDPDLGGTP